MTGFTWKLKVFPLNDKVSSQQCKQRFSSNNIKKPLQLFK